MSIPNYPTPEEYEHQGGKNYNDKAATDRHAYPPPETGSKKAYILVVDEEDPNYPVDEDEDYALSKFRERSQRMLFVRKVLGSVGLQLFACTAFVLFCMLEPNTKTFFRGLAGQMIAFICSIVWFTLFIAIACCKLGYGKPNPVNISLMILSTVLLSVYVAAYVVFYDIVQIAIAAGTTLGVVLILALITFHSKFDITGYMAYIFMAFLALFLFILISSLLIAFGVISISANTAFIISMVISGLLVIFFSVMILYNLKLIVGGGKQKYGEDDWLLASITLFYDIIILFLELLNLSRLMR